MLAMIPEKDLGKLRYQRRPYYQFKSMFVS